MKTETEKAVDGMKKVWIKLHYAEYNHLEDDALRHAGDVIEVEAQRAEALIQRGHATKASAPRKRK